MSEISKQMLNGSGSVIRMSKDTRLQYKAQLPDIPLFIFEQIRIMFCEICCDREYVFVGSLTNC